MKRGLALVVLAGCYGEIGNVGTPPPDDGPRNLCEPGARDVPGPRLLRRTTGPELAATIRGAFGFTAAEWPGPAVPSDAAGRNGFTNNVDRLIVDDAYAQGLLATAEQVADAVLDPPVLSRVLPCAGTGGAACARTYLDTVGRRLYRRPMTETEAARYLDLHAAITAEEDFAAWVRWSTVAMVQSPHVVYRSEHPERAPARSAGASRRVALPRDRLRGGDDGLAVSGVGVSTAHPARADRCSFLGEGPRCLPVSERELSLCLAQFEVGEACVPLDRVESRLRGRRVAGAERGVPANIVGFIGERVANVLGKRSNVRLDERAGVARQLGRPAERGDEGDIHENSPIRRLRDCGSERFVASAENQPRCLDGFRARRVQQHRGDQVPVSIPTTCRDLR